MTIHSDYPPGAGGVFAVRDLLEVIDDTRDCPWQCRICDPTGRYRAYGQRGCPVTDLPAAAPWVAPTRAGAA